MKDGVDALERAGQGRSLLRLRGWAGVYLNRGRVAGFPYVDPNFTQPAIGIRAEDRALLVRDTAPAGFHDIDCFLRDAETIAGIARIRPLDLPRGAMAARGGILLNRGFALDKLQTIVAGLTWNVGRVGFDCVAFFSRADPLLLADRSLDQREIAIPIEPEDTLVFAAHRAVFLFASSFSDLAELPASSPIGE